MFKIIRTRTEKESPKEGRSEVTRRRGVAEGEPIEAIHKNRLIAGYLPFDTKKVQPV